MSACNASGSPASRAINATTAAMLPPALSPATAMRDGSPSKTDVLFATHWNAVQQSSSGSGYGCSGANRYSTETTVACAAFASERVNAS